MTTYNSKTKAVPPPSIESQPYSPQVNYADMGNDLHQDVMYSYQSPGQGYGPDLTPNPWEAQLSQTVGTYTNPYQAQYDALAAQAMAFGTKDYSKEMAELAKKGVDEAKAQEEEMLGALGMKELGLRQDVQDDWAERYADAETQSMINAEALEMQGFALATQSLATLSGPALDQYIYDTNALLGGSDEWLEYQRLMMPMMETMGAAEAPQPTQYPGMRAT